MPQLATAGHISYGYHQEGKYMAFHVTDTGMGIAPDKVDRVFERFVRWLTCHRARIRTFILQDYHRTPGGNISVTSEVGKGTTSTFVLPLEAASKTEAEKKEENNREATVEAHSTEQRSRNTAPELPEE